MREKIFPNTYNCHDCKMHLTEITKCVIILKKNNQDITKLILCKKCKDMREKK